MYIILYILYIIYYILYILYYMFYIFLQDKSNFLLGINTSLLVISQRADR